MNTCKTCKHWGEQVELGPCDDPSLVGLHYCKAPMSNDADCVGLDHDRMQDKLLGNFLTGPSFGCIHWESKA